jgi:hypothetical protein
MPYCKLDDENWQSLIHTIRQGNCILMLGSGASLESYNGKELPCSEIFANELAEKINEKIESWGINLDTSNLAQIAQYYCMEKDRNMLEASATDFYLKRKNSTNELHKNLAALPFSFIITSAQDSMMCNAFKNHKKYPRVPIVERYHFCGDNLEMVEEGTKENPLIFHLYGTINEPDSLVLTEDDFLNFLILKHPLPKNIASALKTKNKSMLFLGFGFNHWYSRVLLHFLKVRNKNNRSFALEQKLPLNIDEFKRTLIFFKETDYKIQFFKDDLQTFTKKLKEKFEEYGKCLQPTSSKVISDDALTVFICHANEDKEKASIIYKKLEAEGCRAWLDKENLRGGDDWDKHIQKTIKNIDYFLVLQSRALEDKLEGYVNKEIHFALDRQRYFKAGIRFIIPLKIEECKLHEDLEHLHTIDLSKQENFPELIKTIKRDQQRRKKR